MSIRFTNYSMLTGKKHDQDWYEWCVFTDADRETVNRIKAIEYKLHPTFPNPTRLITDNKHRFALLSSGWGEFSIQIHIMYEDGNEEPASYGLQLAENNWPRKQPPPKFDSADEDLIYEILAEGKYRSRKLGTLVDKTGFPRKRVEELLHKLEDGEFVRKLPFLSLDGEELWSATSIVGILPRL